MLKYTIFTWEYRKQKICIVEKKTGTKLFSCTSEQLTAKLLKKTYNNWEQTRVKIPKPDRNLPYNLKKIKNLNCEIKFLQLIVLADLILAILKNTENVAQWLEHFSLKHRVQIVER